MRACNATWLVFGVSSGDSLSRAKKLAAPIIFHEIIRMQFSNWLTSLRRPVDRNILARWFLKNSLTPSLCNKAGVIIWACRFRFVDYAKQSECAHTLSKTPPHSPLHDLNVHNASNQRKIFALHIKNPATVLAKPLNYLIHARVCERDVKNVLKGGCRSVEVNSEKKIYFRAILC